MPTSSHDRLQHILDRIALIDELWRATDFGSARADNIRWPAFERHLEVISEASREIPSQWKAKHGSEIAWDKVAGLGNLLRHVCHHVDGIILWDIYENDLNPLEDAVAAMLADGSIAN